MALFRCSVRCLGPYLLCTRTNNTPVMMFPLICCVIQPGPLPQARQVSALVLPLIHPSLSLSLLPALTQTFLHTQVQNVKTALTERCSSSPFYHPLSLYLSISLSLFLLSLSLSLTPLSITFSIYPFLFLSFSFGFREWGKMSLW